MLNYKDYKVVIYFDNTIRFLEVTKNNKSLFVYDVENESMKSFEHNKGSLNSTVMNSILRGSLYSTRHDNTNDKVYLLVGSSRFPDYGSDEFKIGDKLSKKEIRYTTYTKKGLSFYEQKVRSNASKTKESINTNK